jgi:hypothetical protein
MGFEKTRLCSYSTHPPSVYGVGANIGLSYGGGSYYSLLKRNPKVVKATSVEISPTAPAVPLGVSPSPHPTFESAVNPKEAYPSQDVNSPAVNVKNIEAAALQDLKKAAKGPEKRKSVSASAEKVSHKKSRHAGGFNVV